MTSIDTKERARDARHAIEQAAAANGVYVGGPLDSEIDRILIAALEAQVLKYQRTLDVLIDAADDGAWHSSRDCRVERRATTCDLCKALKKARKLTSDAPAVRQ